MTAVALMPESPRRFRGVMRIARYNWPQYVVGTLAVCAAVALLRWVNMPFAVRAVLVAGAAVAAWWIVASLLASHWIYDRSRAARWDWLPLVLDAAPANWLNIHSGLDDASPAIARLFPGARGRVFDFFDAAEMTEPSITRARGGRENAVAAERVDFRRLPVEAGAADAVFLIFAAHEIRAAASRAVFFTEVRRALRPGGQVVVVEHLRDVANAVAFGPGAWHFHSRATWLAAFAATKFDLTREFAITPFVRVFVLRRLP